MKNVLKEVLSTSIYLLVVLCAAYLIITYVGQRTQVSGSSMEATLSENDNLIVDKITYRFSDPQRFDIIVFPYEPNFAYYVDTEPVYYIKRIIGMPGERIRIDEQGNIYINDKILEESYGKEVIMYAGRASETIELGENEYFVMGDNRNNSEDSRSGNIGMVHRDLITGKVWFQLGTKQKRMGLMKE